MISCSCDSVIDSRRVPHRYNCNFLRNKLRDTCCDAYLESKELLIPRHNDWCDTQTKKPAPPKRAMLARLLVYEGTEEWIQQCISKNIKEGYSQYGQYNSINSTTVCYREDIPSA